MGLSVHGPFYTWAFLYALIQCTTIHGCVNLRMQLLYDNPILCTDVLYDCNDILALNLLSISYSSIANASHT